MEHQTSETQPIFEVIAGANRQHFKIYADGRIEGFDRPAYINNGIPAYLSRIQSHSSFESDSPVSGFALFREALLQLDAENAP